MSLNPSQCLKGKMNMHDDALWRQPFLDRLGVEDGAPVATIRRAYARALKRIDQEADPAGFQLLREAYEALMRWIADGTGPSPVNALNMASQAGPAESTAPLVQQARPIGEAAETLADVAYAQFDKAAAALVQAGQADDQDAWEKALSDTRRSDAQSNVSARTLFESRIAARLVQGWSPGHHILFSAALAVFQWRADRQRIQYFGYAGAVLDQAIEEMVMTERQAPGEADHQRRVLLRLRQHNRPDGQSLGIAMFHLEQLLHRFPALSSVTVDVQAVTQWREAHAALPEVEKGKPFIPDETAWTEDTPRVGARFSAGDSQPNLFAGILVGLYIMYQLITYLF